ncbi:metal ABC transporter permease [Aquimarina sp. ERC-38]|uniref:metal ABC transporter permease n=1 Tax=Aquimarina sp. ERC-38 TaxID=2949996 RepID=UPI002245F854|nr:metal ABC transporter permease [Aquimarina sp. ERC-38]UZO79313.1 metal ABC transporter permease [Aquimarina sp. ERC-38]
MNDAQLEIQVIAALVAVACAIPGTFLVLRKMALITDAISHSILPGIVIGFFITQDLSSPLLIILAALFGILTVVLVEYIQKTGLVKEDTAIGLVFPVLFSIGVILIAKNANDVHLDIDAVLLGELAFAPFDRLSYHGMDLGPKSLWVIGTITLSSILLLFLFFKELKVSTFDPGIAATMGLSPVIMHYGLMTVSSITTVGAFDAVGAILVIAFMIAPAASAYLLTNDLKKMLYLAILFGVFSAISGYWLAHGLDSSISGAMTTVLGILFLVIYLFAPGRGYFSNWYKKKQQKTEVSLLVFLLHINNHEEESERHVSHLNDHINWQKTESKTIINLAKRNNFIEINNQIISLTEKGLLFTEKAIDYIITNKDGEIESMKDQFFLFRG